jgi:hypothetical protein
VTENSEKAEIWSPQKALGDQKQRKNRKQVSKEDARNPGISSKQVTKAQKMCFSSRYKSTIQPFIKKKHGYLTSMLFSYLLMVKGSWL